jgi:hypothetical protein
MRRGSSRNVAAEYGNCPSSKMSNRYKKDSQRLHPGINLVRNFWLHLFLLISLTLHMWWSYMTSSSDVEVDSDGRKLMIVCLLEEA